MKLSRRHTIAASAALAAAAVGQTAAAQSAATDAMTGRDNPLQLAPKPVIYVARRIITMEAGQPMATAVAVSGAHVLAVGSAEDVIRALGDRPYDIDRRFADKVVVPGFVEHHLHPLLGAGTMSADAVIAIEDWRMPSRTWPAASDASSYWAALKMALADSKTGPATFMTWGYHHEFHGPLSRDSLDAVSPVRPLVVWHRSCHELFLNSAAIAKYGLTSDDMRGHGLASEQVDLAKGHFYEKGLTLVAGPLMKDVLTPQRLRAGLETLQLYLHSKGVTTICEPGTQLVRPLHELYETVLSADNVPFRTYFIPDGRALYDQAKERGTLDKLVAATQSFMAWGRGKVRWLPQQVKLFADGAVFSLLMQMKEPYLDQHHGEWIALPVDYGAAVRTYWDAGYQIHTHVNGDAGLEVVVRALEERMAKAPRPDHRFTIVHFASSTEEQVRRLGRTGGIVSANPYYVTALADRFGAVGLGPDRADSMVRLASVQRQELPISLHSDMPMAPADPLLLAWAAATRTTASGRVASPDQCITAEQALRAVTIDSAYTIRLEDQIGSIKPGKLADFTILEDDPLAVPPSALRQIQVWGVVFEGNVRPADQPPQREGAAPGTPLVLARLPASASSCNCASHHGAAIGCGCGGVMLQALSEAFAESPT
jgi:predicted amidohydrolase YtcJ